MRRDLQMLYVLLTITSGQTALANPTTTKVCLSGFCVAELHSTEKAVVKKLGHGIRTHHPDDIGDSRCYFDSAAGLWADFTFAGKEESSRKGELRGIMLTEQKLCDSQRTERKVNLGRQLAGVSIGMAESEVLAFLGQPTRIDDAREREARRPILADTRYSAKFGDSVLVYDKPDDLGFTFIFLKEGRVRTIWFSNSE